ncbi:hypothetical protein EDB80DRAFT_304527 [Ilyonectria destructans]|nr:hypothetical protein EDB80DRAFT_304527 [Ilyonectria destructans]
MVSRSCFTTGQSSTPRTSRCGPSSSSVVFWAVSLELDTAIHPGSPHLHSFTPLAVTVQTLAPSLVPPDTDGRFCSLDGRQTNAAPAWFWHGSAFQSSSSFFPLRRPHPIHHIPRCLRGTCATDANQPWLGLTRRYLSLSPQRQTCPGSFALQAPAPSSTRLHLSKLALPPASLLPMRSPKICKLKLPSSQKSSRVSAKSATPASTPVRQVSLSTDATRGRLINR